MFLYKIRLFRGDIQIRKLKVVRETKKRYFFDKDEEGNNVYPEFISKDYVKNKLYDNYKGGYSNTKEDAFKILKTYINGNIENLNNEIDDLNKKIECYNNILKYIDKMENNQICL